ncbi:amidohydrolase [Rhodococcus sp. Z13]|uniref:Amidohydrolase n=1 Tax=Rhodococcus sacchari TaxID=2962047 RepID=A0ACD4DFW9_9NOCA|nr:amidohydrolase [Rhodococcus sp. Z13]UYP18924.1 amidohydrolase [Rhodococcus sp. Z13]
MTPPRVDVHQHVWPASLLAALRARTRPPRLVDWTLHLEGEPPYEVRPEDHSVAERAGLAARDGVDRVLVSLSSPLGIEALPPREAAVLLDAYHEGVLALPDPFAAWAAASVHDPDPDALRDVLAAGCVGLQLPATALCDAEGYGRCTPLLEELDRIGAPLFVHPGPAAARPSDPSWWPAMVSYVAQMHTAWFAWHEYGAPRFPRLRVVFAMLAGLAPLHRDRMAARGGPPVPSAGVFVETSSYGPEIVASVGEVLGPERVVLGSDRPYAAPLLLGDECDGPVRRYNPAALFDGSHARKP